MSDFYNDFQASLFAFCKQVATDLGSLEIFKFDAAATIEDLPKVDLIGIGAFTIETDHIDIAHAMILVSTFDDPNLDRMDRIIGTVYKRLMPAKTVPFLNADTGDQQGLLTVMDGTAALPVEKTRVRPLKAVAVRLGADKPQSP